MLTITLAQLKSDITRKLKGTSLRQVTNFYDVAASAANRMLTRIQPDETRRTVTLATPFFDNLNDYALPTDYKRTIDIRPTAGRQSLPGRSDFSQTTPRQFDENKDDNSSSIQWNNMVRTLRAQRLPAGNVIQMDTFDSATGAGSWAAGGQASGLYVENLNFVQGQASLGFNLSTVGGTGTLINSTAPVTDMSAYKYNDASMLFVYIPTGYSSRFTSFSLYRGSSASAYKKVTVTTKADGTAFTDGWNLLLFKWNTATTNGSPDDTRNTYRELDVVYTAGTAITGVLVDNWTDSLGTLYEIEYYSEYMFRTSAGAWIQTPTSDNDLVNVSVASYEILKNEMMIDITQDLRTGPTRQAELAELRTMLNGQGSSKYSRDPQSAGLYADYITQFPSSAIPVVTQYYQFNV